MKFTSAIVVAALLNCSDVNAIKMPTKFIESSDVQMSEEPAGEAIQKRLDSAKSQDESIDKKKDAEKRAKAVGEKMKKDKEASDKMIEDKEAKANAAKEKEVEDRIKRNQNQMDTNKAAMEADMAKSEAIKIKPAFEQSPSGTTGGSATLTDAENWTADMPQYVLDGKRGPSSKVTAAPTLEEIAAKKKADVKNAAAVAKADAAVAASVSPAAASAVES